MEARFKIQATDLDKFLEGKPLSTSKFDSTRKSIIYPTLDKFIIGDGEILDGEALQEEIFPY